MMEPVLALSPTSPSHHLTSTSTPGRCGLTQTTPKLPRRERLASFSRLIASESFLEFLPNKSSGKRQRNFRGRDLVLESLPSIRISPSSPTKRSAERNDSSFLNNARKGCLDSHQLPFSPKLLNSKSPKYLSPSYKQPTPTKSPLYVSERKGLFLGRGSFGNVSLCIYKGSKFALKIAHHKGVSVGEKNFIGIRHPHLVTILHISHVSERVFICMEFAGHCNLQQVLDTRSELDFPRRLSFCIQILSGLRHCHQHLIVHADVKPANVIVSPHGICKLGDFGHSIKLDAPGTVHRAEDVVGTAAYAAPEVLRGARPSLESDMYSFGILLWQVQSRELPFSGEHPHVIIYKVAHYGSRPIFNDDGSWQTKDYSEVAKLCWTDDPAKRLCATAALSMLQYIAQEMKRLD